MTAPTSLVAPMRLVAIDAAPFPGAPSNLVRVTVETTAEGALGLARMLPMGQSAAFERVEVRRDHAPPGEARTPCEECGALACAAPSCARKIADRRGVPPHRGVTP